MGGWAVEVTLRAGGKPDAATRAGSIINSLSPSAGSIENPADGTWRVPYDNDSLEDAVVHLRYDLTAIDPDWRECLAIVNRSPATARLPS